INTTGIAAASPSSRHVYGKGGWRGTSAKGVCVVSRKLLYLIFALLVSVIVAMPQVADARGGGGRGGGGGHGFGGGGHGFGGFHLGGHGFGGFHGFGGHRIGFRGFGGRHFFGHRGVHVVR